MRAGIWLPGVGSIPGAISSVTIEGEQAVCRTIRDKYPPVGICGTGVIETAAELLRAGWMDETGYLDEERWEDGVVLAENETGSPIVFTQKDIREIQLAKAAVRAGMEVLLSHFGTDWKQVR